MRAFTPILGTQRKGQITHQSSRLSSASYCRDSAADTDSKVLEFGLGGARVVISDQLFRAYLMCRTKAYQLFFADPGRIRSLDSICEWQMQINDDYCRGYVKSFVSDNPNACFNAATTNSELKTRDYQWLVGSKISIGDLVSNIPLLENLSYRSIRASSRGLIPIRIFSSEKVHNDQKQLLAFDALVLGNATGHFPTVGKIVHGRQQTVSRVKLPNLICKAEFLIGEIHAMFEMKTPPSFGLIKHCHECEFESQCMDRARKDDNISLLRMIPPKEITNLRNKGIFTVTQLSYTFRPRRRKAKGDVKQVGKYKYALKALAIRERTTYIVGTPDYALDGTPIYLDVEGIPEQSLYYLIGVRVVSGDSVLKWSFWANDKNEEEQIWREFLNLMSSLENPVLLHYGSFETKFLKIMQTRHGSSLDTGFSISHLADNAINVLSLVYTHIYFPTYTNGLKDIARHLGFRWSTNNPSGAKSLLLRHKWKHTNDESIKRELVSYNQDDCEALEYVVKAITTMVPKEGDTANVDLPPMAIHIDSLKKASRPFSYYKKEFAFPELAHITKCSYWDYQRDRIYVRTNKRIKAIAKRNIAGKATRVVPINKVISPTRLSQCPNCGSTRFFMSGRHGRTTYDLRFTSGGIKRWVIKKIVDHHKCKECGSTFVSDNALTPRYRYGSQLLAYVIYSLIELHIAQFQLVKIIRKLFELPLSQQTIGNMKHRAAEYYNETFQEIRSTLIHGELIHADETHVSVEGQDSYVWVFTSMEEVVYLWSDTREAKTATELLSDFTGVLVSDFYTAYDSIECPQQKCLIHLIRDLNDAVFKEPFNLEMKTIVHEFAKLMRKIIVTVDQFGLKKYFLKKHIADVERFFKTVMVRRYETASTRKLQTRFRKNRNKLFTFLEFDNVPWNNNNAEHAVKAFARGIRDRIGGRTSQHGIADYLVLLSIYQTCEYRGIDFLKFLRSGETRLSNYQKKLGRQPVSD
jgi:predicted RecB family nuclease